MNIVKIVESKIILDEIVNSVSSSNCGATSLFIGTTRDNFEGKKVIRLEYEAYEPMALKEMEKVCNKVRERWKVQNIAIVHRVGLVPVKEASVVIGISSDHRQESLEAVQFTIDNLKESVPIWKKEVYEPESSSDQQTTEEWKANKECKWNNLEH